MVLELRERNDIAPQELADKPPASPEVSPTLSCINLIVKTGRGALKDFDIFRIGAPGYYFTLTDNRNYSGTFGTGLDALEFLNRRRLNGCPLDEFGIYRNDDKMPMPQDRKARYIAPDGTVVELFIK